MFKYIIELLAMVMFLSASFWLEVTKLKNKIAKVYNYDYLYRLGDIK